MLRQPPAAVENRFCPPPQKTDLHFCLRATTFGDSGGWRVRRGRPGRRRLCLINERLFIVDLFCFPLSCPANRLRAPRQCCRRPRSVSANKTRLAFLASGGRVDGQIVEMIIFQKQSAAALTLLWKTSECVCRGGWRTVANGEQQERQQWQRRRRSNGFIMN